MSNRPCGQSRIRQSLGTRIALRYSCFLLGSLLWHLLVFSAVFWFCTLNSASQTARSMASAFDPAYTNLFIRQGRVAAAETDLSAQRMFGIMDGDLCLTIETAAEERSIYVAYSLTEEVSLFRVLLITLILLELLRIVSLIRRGEKISRRALRPITEIAETARRLSASNLSERIEIHGAKTELLELSQILNDMLDRIESSYNAQKQFTSDASHELRTPISVIQGYADMLARWGKTDADIQNESIAAIRSEAAGMKELVEQLLFIARHDNRPGQYEKVYFDAAELTDEIFRDTQLIASNHMVRHAEMNRAIILGDRNKLKQALRIFVDNAIKYTPPGGTISISCRKEEKYCRITIADTGIGIAEEEMTQIFERFYRCEEVRSDAVDGHGLGLSIARMIIRAHSGQMEVQSKKGIGSRFHILLPL